MQTMNNRITQFHRIAESRFLFIMRICFVSELGIQIANKIGSIFILQKIGTTLSHVIIFLASST